MKRSPPVRASLYAPRFTLYDFTESMMYVIVVYDINEKRVGRTLKVCRQFLNWVQNSVFEGETTPAKLKELKLRLKKVMNEKEDSVLIYAFAEQRLMEKEVLGQERNPTDSFL